MGALKQVLVIAKGALIDKHGDDKTWQPHSTSELLLMLTMLSACVYPFGVSNNVIIGPTLKLKNINFEWQNIMVIKLNKVERQNCWN